MRKILCFNYIDYEVENFADYPGGRDSYVYIIFELDDDYIDCPDKKVYRTFDGSLKALPKFSSWDKDFRNKVIRYCERKLSGIGGEVWIDDVRIK